MPHDRGHELGPTPLSHFTITLDIRREFAPSMGDLADMIGAALEARGAWETDYYVEVKGPPELRITAVERGRG